MSTGEKKTTATPPSPPPDAPKQEPKQAQKRGFLSRRTFLKAAVGASTVLAAASMSSSGQILSPLIPARQQPLNIANAVDLESEYDAVRNIEPSKRPVVSRFFYWPYKETESPYYKNVLVRLPDELLTDPGSTAPTLSHYAGWNITCVHLRCIVNPGYEPNFKEFRLICPCHGSQYRLTDAVPVYGPAFFLGLRPLPRIRLSLDSGANIIAEEIQGEPGIGRTQI